MCAHCGTCVGMRDHVYIVRGACLLESLRILNGSFSQPSCCCWLQCGAKFVQIHTADISCKIGVHRRVGCEKLLHCRRHINKRRRHPQYTQPCGELGDLLIITCTRTHLQALFHPLTAAPYAAVNKSRCHREHCARAHV